MLYVNPMEASPALGTDPARIKAQRETKALEEFERVFLYQMLREMRSAVPVEGIFEKSPAREFFEESLDDALAGQMARSNQLGIAQQIKAQWEQTASARTTRDNGLQDSAARGKVLHPELRGMTLESAPTIHAIAPPSSQAAGLPIRTNTPFSFESAAGREGED